MHTAYRVQHMAHTEFWFLKKIENMLTPTLEAIFMIFFFFNFIFIAKQTIVIGLHLHMAYVDGSYCSAHRNQPINKWDDCESHTINFAK